MAPLRSYLVIPIALSSLLALVGCGEAGEGNKESEVQILEFTAARSEIQEGESTTLQWSTKNAVSVALLENGIKRGSEALPVEGSLEVSPLRDTTYRLEAWGADGRLAWSEVTVSVAPLGPPVIESFQASPTETRSGNAVGLKWKVRSASNVQILDAGGRVLHRDTASEGEFEVHPSSTTTYELRAHNAYGTVSAQARVTIVAAPKISLSASETRVPYGHSVTLSWEVEGATDVHIADPKGKILYEGPGTSGSVKVDVEVAGAYRATALGIGGEASDTVEIDVEPRIVTFTARVFESARPGSLALVEWEVLGADRIAIFNGLNVVHETSETEGQASVPVGYSGDFEIRAYAGSLLVQEHTRIEVQATPLIRRLSTGPLVTAGQGVSGVSTIGWEIDGASKIALVVEPGGLVDTTSKSPRKDEVQVLFTAPGKVTLTAFNHAGQSSVTIDSPVVPVPTFDAFFAAPSRVAPGEPVEIHWDTSDAVRVVLEQDGVEVGVDPSMVDGFAEIEAIGAPSTFVLRAYNSLDFEAVSEPITVQIGPPNSLRFDTADGLRQYRAGSVVDLVWANDGGSSLTLTNTATGQVVYSTTNAVEIRNGSYALQLPATQTEVPLELVVTNGAGTDRRTLDLMAVTGPLVVDFFTDVTAITEGQSVLFSWVVQPDVDGNVPTLSLVDDRGVVYPLDGTDPLQDSKRFNVFGWAATPRVFTLTATSSVPPSNSRSVEVMVYGVPTVDRLTANPPFAATEGEPITIEWQTTHGVSLALYPVARTGEVQATPIFTTNDPAVVAQGSTTFQPTKNVPHLRLVVTNPTGTSTAADLRVGVDPATIESFTANGVEAPQQVDLLYGEELTLAWDIVRSTDAVLLEEFIDLSQRPTATKLNPSATTSSGRVRLDFPPGFVFPYDGGQHTYVTITNSGYLAFDYEHTTVATADQPMPYAGTTWSAAAVDLAPFWDAMQNGSIYWELFEGEVDRLVIQWSGFEFSTTSYNPADLNFQVVLFEDGRFEYRYGPMEGSHAAARASLATIGAQSWACPGYVCPYGVQLVHQTEQPNGLEGRVYRFEGLRGYREDQSTPIPMPMNGSRTFKPVDTRTYTIRAWNGHSEHERSIRVAVHPRAELVVWTEPTYPQPGDTISLHWNGKALTSLVIEDGAGNVIHTATPSELGGGSIVLGALPLGAHRYTLRGMGQIARDQVVRDFDVVVDAPFSIDQFTVSDDLIQLGESVTLSWAATNATSVQIVAKPGGPLSVPPTPNGGSVIHQPEQTTTYVLVVESNGRTLTEERTVEVRQVWFEDFQVSATEVPFGSSVEISWEIADPTGQAEVRVEPYWRAYQMREVTNEAPFQSIVGNGGTPLPTQGTATTGYSDVEFPAGFVFPFLGSEKTWARAFNFGYLNFASTQALGTTTDFVMPRYYSTSYPEGVMGVFWGSLSQQTTGKIYTKFVQDPSNPEKDHLIIEWANFQFSTTSYNPADLNFQIVLFRDGTFDYRYGTMTAANAAQANGSSVGIGFVNGNWGERPYQLGFQLLYDVEMPGGTANRSWRYEPVPQKAIGSWKVAAWDSGPVRICARTPQWEECQEQFITVFRPGDVAISELMVDPGPGGRQWFEIRNLGVGPLDLEGKTLRIGNSTHVIQTGGAFLVPPGGHAVFAPEYDPAVDPDYVYGTHLVLGTPAGSVAIEWDGMVLGETSWNSSWTFTPGVAKELLATKERPGDITRSNAADYCDSQEPFGLGMYYGTPGGRGGACATAQGYVVDFAANQPFIDIRDTGERVFYVSLNTAINGSIFQLSQLGFTVPFFAGSSSQLWGTYKGLLGLSGSPVASGSNRNLTGSGTGAGQGLIAPFWDDLAGCQQDSAIYVDERTVGNRQVLIVQFDGVKFYSQSYPGCMYYQVQIWDDGDIAFVYGDNWRTYWISNTLRYFEGSSATVGLEGFNAGQSIVYLYSEPRLRAYQSFYFKKL